MATTAYRGRDFLLQLASTTSPTSWTSIAGLRATAISINNNPVDVTNKGSNGYRELLVDGGVQQFSISGDGIYLASGADSRLFTVSLARTVINCRVLSGVGDKFIGDFVVASYQRSGSFDGAEQFSVSLESTGTLVYQA